METLPIEIHSLPGHLIRRLNQIAVAQFMARMSLEGLDLTPVQFAALAAVHGNPGIDQASIAGEIAYDRATLGKVIDRLEAKGLVHRQVSQADRRAREVRLTGEGERLLARAHPAVRAAQPEILTGLSQDERRQFVALLKKAIAAGNTLSRAPHQPLRKRV